jgi:hypothetical protein
MPIILSKRVQVKLRDSANAAVWHGAQYASPSALRSEVTSLKNLINNGIPLIDTEWRKILGNSGITASLQGFVCHGRPFVRFCNHQKSCELGDFLLVHEHQPNYGPAERRAIIVQAKVFYDKGGVKLPSRNALQLELYNSWPAFTYTDWPGGLSSLSSILVSQGISDLQPNLFTRDVSIVGSASAVGASRETVKSGCRYGLIEVDYIDSYMNGRYKRGLWRMSAPDAHPDVYTTRRGFKFGTYLARLIRGDAGRLAPVKAWPTDIGSACHWSLIVNELTSLMPISVSIPTVRALSAAAISQLPNSKIPLDQTQSAQPDGPNTPGKGASKGFEEGGFAIILLKTEGGEARA